MKRFSAQYVITNTGNQLKRAVVKTDDDGTIIGIDDTAGNLKEEPDIEYHNGILIPGFINCHCHLELSHMKGLVSKATGLADFILNIRNSRHASDEQIYQASLSADNLMYREGIALCADICNTSSTFSIKKTSKIKYINLAEVFGLDPDKAEKRMNEARAVANAAALNDLLCYLVPHSVYSMSRTLMRMLKNETINNTVTSIHFMETRAEDEFLREKEGDLMTAYERSGLLPVRLETASDHTAAILNEITSSGNLILVHNTFIDTKTVESLKQRNNLYFCLCPNSNLYIEDALPPLKLLVEAGCTITIGTDSLASNTNLSILGELKTLQNNYPDLNIGDLVAWATVNGAKALASEDTFGSLAPGKRPGIVLLENVDLQNMKLLPESTVTRLI
jgi:aminodeoxyfutalosine deaminase